MLTQVADLWFSLSEKQCRHLRRVLTHSLVAGEQLTNACLLLFVQVESEQQASFLDRVIALRDKQKRQLNQPFLRFRRPDD
jgi:hypothetical protein